MYLITLEKEVVKLVYRTKSKNIAFNKEDFVRLMTRQFHVANTMEEINLIKDTFVNIIEDVSNEIAYENGFIEKQEDKKEWYCEENPQARYYNRYGY